METEENKIFEGNDFALQVMAVGSFVDSGCGNGKLYQVEATTVRLNHAAYNEWLFCHKAPDRDGFESAAEWEAAKMERVKRFQAWVQNVRTALHMEAYDSGTISISHAHAEVFIVVRVREIAAMEEPE